MVSYCNLSKDDNKKVSHYESIFIYSRFLSIPSFIIVFKVFLISNIRRFNGSELKKYIFVLFIYFSPSQIKYPLSERKK